MANTDLQKFNQTIRNANVTQYLQDVLGEKKEQFVTSIVSLVGNNTLLQKCDPMSVMYSATKAAALNLPFDPSLGMAWCVPYGNQAQFQLGAKGYAQLAIRSGQFQKIYVTEIYEGEFGGISRKTGEVKINEDVDTTGKPVVGYYGYYRLTNGYEYECYFTKEQIMAHGKRFSKTFNNGPWKTDFDAMAKKTVLKKLLRDGNAPMSIDMQMAMKADQSVISRDAEGNEQFTYVDNPETRANTFADVAAEAAEAQVVDESTGEVIQTEIAM